MSVNKLNDNELQMVFGGSLIRDAAAVMFELTGLGVLGLAATNIFYPPTGHGIKGKFIHVFVAHKIKHTAILVGANYILPFVGAVTFGVGGLVWDAIFGRGGSTK